ncbi:hypothetical protein [Planococcus shenhongbingii]|uniref:Uncharacterized protein n=1 Tax=Planococcus shenhongbingii TaxID=3058398 RepID=A0ABT8NCQ7_9BACL|nr:hypothetical protein [Planococcus sp. N017]MDN7245479.1 hypothetical protein [Planococcus sp. N017]
MDNKDIADICKRFKLDTDSLKIADIHNVYIQQESMASKATASDSSHLCVAM